MRFFKKGDRVLIKYCCIRNYIGLTGTIISYTKGNYYDTKGSIHITIDEKFYNVLNKEHWVTDPTFYDNLIDLVPIGTKILKNE